MSPIPSQRSEGIAIGCSCGTGTCENCAREMRAQIRAVRRLHRPVKPHRDGIEVCEACSELKSVLGPTARARAGEGFKVGVAYPCATIRTLDAHGA